MDNKYSMQEAIENPEKFANMILMDGLIEPPKDMEKHILSAINKKRFVSAVSVFKMSVAAVIAITMVSTGFFDRFINVLYKLPNTPVQTNAIERLAYKYEQGFSKFSSYVNNDFKGEIKNEKK